MNEQIKKQAFDLIKEAKKRFENNKILRYNTGKLVHKKQLEFHKCQKKNRWVFGGNRTGKTECGAVEAIWLLTGTHPYKPNKKDVCGWSVSLSSQVQRDVAQSKILNYLNPNLIEDIIMSSGKKESPASGVIDKIYIKNVFGGTSVLGFKSCDQGREKFQGTSLDFVWFDEEPPYDIYLECKMRVLDKRGQIFGTMTPLKGQTWVYNEIYLNQKKDDDVWFETISWQDNPFLDEKEVKKLCQTLSGAELDARRDGKFTFANGLVYSNFDEQQNVTEPFDVPTEWYDNISIDPGFHNALSCHFYARDFDGNVYVIAEHFMSEKSVEFHADAIKNIAKKLNWKTDKQGRLNALIDSAGLQKTLASSKSVVDLFYENGILTNPKVKKDLLVGIDKVRRFICSADGTRRLFIFKNCPNLIREIKAYHWGDDDVPVKTDDHSLDELRYYLMSLNEQKEEEYKTDLSQFKEKLLRQKRRKRL